MTEFCSVAPNVCKSSAWNFNITLLASIILRWVLDFWKNYCSPTKGNVEQVRYWYQVSPAFVNKWQHMSLAVLSACKFILFPPKLIPYMLCCCVTVHIPLYLYHRPDLCSVQNVDNARRGQRFKPSPLHSLTAVAITTVTTT